MTDPKLSRRYAEALYEAAKDKDQVDAVMESMNALLEVFHSAPEVERFWMGPQVSPEKKLAVMDEALKSAPEIVRNLLHFLLDKSRDNLLRDILEMLQDIHDRDQGIVRATLVTAIPLDESEMQPFRKMIVSKGGSLILKQEVDARIIAGFQLRMGDSIVDASVKRSIDELARVTSA